MSDEVLTIKEVAALLKLAEKTVYAMANAAEIPAFKVRGQWRIKRTELDRWIDTQIRRGTRARARPRAKPRAAARQRRGSKRDRVAKTGVDPTAYPQPARHVAKPVRRKAASP